MADSDAQSFTTHAVAHQHAWGFDPSLGSHALGTRGTLTISGRHISFGALDGDVLFDIPREEALLAFGSSLGTNNCRVLHNNEAWWITFATEADFAHPIMHRLLMTRGAQLKESVEVMQVKKACQKAAERFGFEIVSPSQWKTVKRDRDEQSRTVSGEAAGSGTITASRADKSDGLQQRVPQRLDELRTAAEGYLGEARAAYQGAVEGAEAALERLRGEHASERLSDRVQSAKEPTGEALSALASQTRAIGDRTATPVDDELPKGVGKKVPAKGSAISEVIQKK